MSNPTSEELKLFKTYLNEYRYDFVRLAYLIFRFGEEGSECEHFAPYDWQVREWQRLSLHLSNPATRYTTYRFCCSSGNGAAKTAWGAMTVLMLMYTQRTRGRLTANTKDQLSQVAWPEYDTWFRRARYSELFFEKHGTSIKALDSQYGERWRFDTFNWSEESPAAISGLHNKGGAVVYVLEEAPGIPAVIFDYAEGAFTETETIKMIFAFGNSDDPESKFEQNMESPIWHSLRIDTRTLKHIDPAQIQAWLIKAGGNEDDDDFRVRVRGLPRKSSADSIIRRENIRAAIARAKDFDVRSVSMLPCILTIDPAWTGGDETTIWYHQGQYSKMLEKYRLDKAQGDTHQLTFQLACKWIKTLRADAVFVDQGEGTALFTLATNAGFTNWILVPFAGTPSDTPDPKDSEYGNMRAMMYYKANERCLKGGVIDAADPAWLDEIEKQLCWTKGSRHKITGKKMAEPKSEIIKRVGMSPDVADGFVLGRAYEILERLPENDNSGAAFGRQTGGEAWKMPEHSVAYEITEAEYQELYD